jgi:hypothetical protein
VGKSNVSIELRCRAFMLQILVFGSVEPRIDGEGTVLKEIWFFTWR